MAMTRKNKDKAIAEWNVKSALIDAARLRRGLDNADGADVESLRPGLVAHDDGLGETQAPTWAVRPEDDDNLLPTMPI